MNTVDAGIVCILGGLVGAAELISRYKDAPVRPLTGTPGWVYIAFNALAGAVALTIMKIFGWTFGVEDPGPLRLTRILVAGFGSLAFFRTSLFITRVGDQDIGVGPSAVLTALLGAADRSVDRGQAKKRSEAVTEIMAGVSFSKARASLPTYCLALLQNVSAEEKTALAEDVAALNNIPDMGELEKALALGLRLMNLVGEDLLRTAVTALKKEISA